MRNANSRIRFTIDSFIAIVQTMMTLWLKVTLIIKFLSRNFANTCVFIGSNTSIHWLLDETQKFYNIFGISNKNEVKLVANRAKKNTRRNRNKKREDIKLTNTYKNIINTLLCVVIYSLLAENGARVNVCVCVCLFFCMRICSVMYFHVRAYR